MTHKQTFTFSTADLLSACEKLKLIPKEVEEITCEINLVDTDDIEHLFSKAKIQIPSHDSLKELLQEPMSMVAYNLEEFAMLDAYEKGRREALKALIETAGPLPVEYEIDNVAQSATAGIIDVSVDFEHTTFTLVEGAHFVNAVTDGMGYFYPQNAPGEDVDLNAAQLAKTLSDFITVYGTLFNAYRYIENCAGRAKLGDADFIKQEIQAEFDMWTADEIAGQIMDCAESHDFDVEFVRGAMEFIAQVNAQIGCGASRQDIKASLRSMAERKASAGQKLLSSLAD